MILRLWFYSEILNVDRSYRGRSPQKPKGKPLHRAIFSFVFGDGDPNAALPERQKKAAVAYIQGNKGVISLPEFMIIMGMSPAQAEESITAFCVEFGGSPEVSDDGTIVYKFEALLLSAEPAKAADAASLLKNLRPFSSNKKNMNVWFGIINTVNLIFGSYFFVNALKAGHIFTQAHFDAASRLYGITYVLLTQFIANPLPFLTFGLGVVPIVFSFLFWLIPSLRFFSNRLSNEGIKLENFRKNVFLRIWKTPLDVHPDTITPANEICSPKDIGKARDRLVNEMASYSQPEVTVTEEGETVFAFEELQREKIALTKYRGQQDNVRLGDVVFEA
jgi:hypothetical protein